MNATGRIVLAGGSGPALLAQFGCWLMRTEVSLALTGRRCTSQHFLARGFEFQFPKLRDALQDLFPRR